MTIASMLSDPSSLRRRQAAKHLRKSGTRESGAALLHALRQELEDERTWETQYHMIMALADCRYAPAIPLLREQLEQPHVHMVALAIGDALLRLEIQEGLDLSDVPAFLKSINEAAAEGGLRGLAMTRIALTERESTEILAWVLERKNESLDFWAAAASAGWNGGAVTAFLEQCLGSSREEIRKAAVAALRGKYLRWNPL